MGFLHVQLARFLLHPILRKSAQGQVVEQVNDQMLVESAHSNPLLGPAVLNSKVPCCAYLLATMLDSEEVDINTRICTLVDTGHCCVNQATILSAALKSF